MLDGYMQRICAHDHGHSWTEPDHLNKHNKQDGPLGLESGYIGMKQGKQFGRGREWNIFSFQSQNAIEAQSEPGNVGMIVTRADGRPRDFGLTLLCAHFCIIASQCPEKCVRP